jgi:hypothetical protein
MLSDITGFRPPTPWYPNMYTPIDFRAEQGPVPKVMSLLLVFTGILLWTMVHGDPLQQRCVKALLRPHVSLTFHFLGYPQ